MNYPNPFKISGLVVIFLVFLIPVHLIASEVEPGSFLDQNSVYVDGQEWSFITEPPPEAERTVRSSHPRLMLTQDNIPQIREKLSHPIYANDLDALKDYADEDYGNEINTFLVEAFIYAVFNDKNRGKSAKEWLLAGKYGQFRGYSTSHEFMGPTLIYDWIFDILNQSEKRKAFKLLKDYYHLHKRGNNHEIDPEPNFKWHHTVVYNRLIAQYYVHLAFVIHNEGIDDDWAEEVIDLAYTDNRHVLGPYSVVNSEGEITSGALDALMMVSLDDGGGEQMSDGNQPGGGYWKYLLYSFYPLAIWDSATDQQILSKYNLYRKMPTAWVYTDWPDKESKFGSKGLAALEYVTGIYKDIDSDEATLAKWLIETYGRDGRSSLVFRLIYGDRRIQSKSPEELGLPTARYIKGMDRFTSRTNWDDNDSVVVSVVSRYLDFARFEPESGTFGIYKNGEPLLVRGGASKHGQRVSIASGLWIYESVDENTVQWGQGWNRVAFDENVYPGVTKSKYFRGGPDNWELNDSYRAITQEYSELYNRPVDTARNTIIHIPDGKREFVVAYYHADIGDGIKTAQSFRLVNEPAINGDSFTVPGGLHVTSVSPGGSSLTWVGGEGDEMRSPPPEKMWVASTGRGNIPGYSEHSAFKSHVKTKGLGNLYIQPSEEADSYDYLSVIQVSDLEPMPVTKISDTEVQFGDWQVSVSPSGEYSVRKNSEDIAQGLNPPQSLKIQTN